MFGKHGRGGGREARDGRDELEQEQKWLLGEEDSLQAFVTHIKRMKDEARGRWPRFANHVSDEVPKPDVIDVHSNTLVEKRGLKTQVSGATAQRRMVTSG